MNSKLIQKLDELYSKHKSISDQLEDENIYQDHALLKKLNQEFSKIDPIIKKYNNYKAAIESIKESEKFLSEKDKELRQMAEDDISANNKIKNSLEEYFETELVDKDPNDSRDAFVEIRAGTGGEEAAIFVGDLFKMYSKFSEKNSWVIELLNVTESDHGGYKELILKITGADVYGNLKYESGTHRVQRVPNTETQGRIHTSASTVAVLPAIDEIDQIDINPADLRIDTYRASGAGGQHVNKTDSAVRITHIPTGTVSECQDGRSQHKNKAQALSILHSKLLMQEQEQQKKNTAEERKNIVGSGDRSERIRTYNYPQGRITDHRINLTLYKLEQILEGNIETLIEELRKASLD
ncbi:MAG: peptide chain release factor 1 [Pseudomonadota bacterium]|nr:peptide chain release factor 1 [Pseudomonadota bacterium]MED5502365.1 peptide chain release factor 1 [Pseudomonadota bacterium]